MDEKVIIEFLNSDIGKAIETLISFAVNKTKTEKDNEILKNINYIVKVIGDNISNIANKNPTDKEAKKAAMLILKAIVEKTETKWDDRAYKVLDIFV